ncbi:hypothetical protein [Natronorubrum sp. FCH18a]|uniref:hypothetical protein n=1 Tax=Natronorubrum sp. FCH18a TaxID=3447018 RepID=UPI003F511A0F
MTDNHSETAVQQSGSKELFDDLLDTLEEFDHPAVSELRSTLATDCLFMMDSPELTVDEWVEALEVLADIVYASASERSRMQDGEYEVHWYFRHDGDEFVYATRSAGELYRGEKAERQIRAVIAEQTVYIHPIATYPLECDSDD